MHVPSCLLSLFFMSWHVLACLVTLHHVLCLWQTSAFVPGWHAAIAQVQRMEAVQPTSPPSASAQADSIAQRVMAGLGSTMTTLQLLWGQIMAPYQTGPSVRVLARGTALPVGVVV